MAVGAESLLLELWQPSKNTAAPLNSMVVDYNLGERTHKTLEDVKNH